MDLDKQKKSKCAENESIIGVISDTHGLLRTAAVNALDGVDLIIHAGDIGSADILAQLKKIAPVVAVRGNMDKENWAKRLPAAEMALVERHYIYVIHELDRLDLDPAAADISVVIFGHTHQPAVQRKDGILMFNPGGAGYRRFNYPVTIGRLTLSNHNITPEIIELPI